MCTTLLNKKIPDQRDKLTICNSIWQTRSLIKYNNLRHFQIHNSQKQAGKKSKQSVGNKETRRTS